MELTANDLDSLLNKAITAAKQAGNVIEHYTNKNVAVKYKTAGDGIASQVLTEVDIKSEAVIVKVLEPTCHQYDLALLTEETDDDQARLHKDYFWCVDPMDGTLAFTESVPGYSVSIALVAQTGEPIIGVVYDPVTHTLYTAVKGQGVFRNGIAWLPDSSHAKGKALTLVCDRGFTEKPYYEELCKQLENAVVKHGYAELKTLEKNGAVLNACYVLEHTPAVYFKLPKPEQGGGSIWDFSATAAIFNELGYIATDFYGDALDLNRTDSTYMNHRGVIFCIEPSLAQSIQGLPVPL